MSLAYIFWHWPRPEVTAAEYRQRIEHFHRTLRRMRPKGLIETRSFELDPPPGIAAGRRVWADWYRLENTAALEDLNIAAVTGASLEPHAEVARLAADGAGSLYSARYGRTVVRDARWVCWFRKPAGWTYAQLDQVVEPLSGPQAGLWRRMMVLGPTPEFCLLGAGPAEVPAELNAEKREMKQVL